jgi:putative NIF3 family GTP cyclohydrolase 1 type 2
MYLFLDVDRDVTNAVSAARVDLLDVVHHLVFLKPTMTAVLATPQQDVQMSAHKTTNRNKKTPLQKVWR